MVIGKLTVNKLRKAPKKSKIITWILLVGLVWALLKLG